MFGLLSIVDWDQHFENNRTRDLKYMAWVPVPTKQDGEGYNALVDHDDGAAHFGAWIAIVEIAAKCSPRGTLIRRDGTALTPQALARKSHLPAGLFEEAIPRLISIGWLHTSQLHEAEQLTTDAAVSPQEGAGLPQEGAASPQVARARGTRNNTEQHGREQHGTTHKGAADKPQVGAGSPQVHAVVEHYRGYHPKARAGDKERRLISARLKEGFSVGDLRLAIDGCHLSKWHCGDNERHRKYQSLGLIVRDADHVVQFVEHAGESGGPQLSEKSRRSLAAIDEFLGVSHGERQ